MTSVSMTAMSFRRDGSVGKVDRRSLCILSSAVQYLPNSFQILDWVNRASISPGFACGTTGEGWELNT